jgi:hypothetical protein
LSTNLRALSYLPWFIKEEKPQPISSFFFVTTYLKDSVPALVLLYVGKMACMSDENCLLACYSFSHHCNQPIQHNSYFYTGLCIFANLKLPTHVHTFQGMYFIKLLCKISLNSCG